MSAWQQGKVSNFDYLLYLNLAAGRSFNDLAQVQPVSQPLEQPPSTRPCHELWQQECQLC
jgi:hypothetical protein